MCSGAHLQENFGLSHFPFFVCPQPRFSNAQGHLASLVSKLPRRKQEWLGGVGAGPRWEAEAPSTKAFWDSSLPPPLGVSVAWPGHRLKALLNKSGARGEPRPRSLEATTPGASAWLLSTWTAPSVGS